MVLSESTNSNVVYYIYVVGCVDDLELIFISLAYPHKDPQTRA